MACAHDLLFNTAAPPLENAFAIEASAIAFGPGVIGELGPRLLATGAKRVAVLTDPVVRDLPIMKSALASLRRSGIEPAVYDGVRVEPSDGSFRDAIAFAKDGRFDGYVSIGGGSVIDTCKAAILYATYPADLPAYVNAPVGEGRPVPGPLPPHIACPTTSGTGSECTGIAVFDWVEKRLKTGIASRFLRPTTALIDPEATATLPPMVVAASGFDVLCHALESYTARPFGTRPRPEAPSLRPMSQGQNPWSDIGSLEALRLAGRYFLRAVTDASDREARHALSWAATLAGIAFGNAGVHLPHAISYAVAGNVRTYRAAGYPGDGEGDPLIPHGISVVVTAPSVFRLTGPSAPGRHRVAAEALGADMSDVAIGGEGDQLAEHLVRLMRAAGVPLGLRALGYDEADVSPLVLGSIVQKRLTSNAPIAVDETVLADIVRGSLAYTANA